jgi:catechol 2,3-dioxygenase-like lactoylglutathione lyase family enzyme
MKITAIDHVAVQTSNLDTALDFYVGILGAELVVRQKFKRRQIAWLRVGNVKIELFSEREGESLKEWSDFYSGPVHISFLVPNLDSFLREALAKGARFHPSHPEPFLPPVPGASKIAYLLGPDGEEVEIRDRDDIKEGNT